MKVNRDDLLRAGEELRRFISSQGFATSVEILKANYVSEIVGSPYGDKEAREQAYQKLVALDDHLSVMTTLALQADINIRQQEEDDQ